MSVIKSIVLKKDKFCVTENGALAHKSTGNRCLNLFFKIGSFRSVRSSIGVKGFHKLVRKAFKEDSDIASKILAWSRDCRGGAGARLPLHIFMGKLVCDNEYTISEYTIDKIVELGYFKDIFNIYNIKDITEANKNAILKWCKKNIEENNPETIGLFSKWFPRKDKLFYDLAKYMKVTYSTLRKLIVKNTKVVENKMCKKEWNEIEFEKVPSIAMNKYSSTFFERCEERFKQYLDDVNNGKKKINTSVLTPMDITLKWIRRQNRDTLNTLWENLNDDLQPKDELLFIPVADVSGSMSCNNNIPLAASIGFSIYLSERNPGVWANQVITFSEKPCLVDLSSSEDFLQKCDKLAKAPWGMNTNIDRTFKLILDILTMNPKALTPTHIVVFSDMQFDEASDKKTNFEAWKESFEAVGLKLPKIVFWNLNPAEGFPAKSTDNVSMVSGFSTSIMEDVFSGKDIDPVRLMLDIVDKEKYKLF